MSGKIRFCKLAKESIANHSEALKNFEDFLVKKAADPIAPYGGKDTHFIGEGPIGRLGLKIKHAHISQDLSVVYRVHSKPPLVDVFGIFAHKELGTGNTPNIKLQKAMAKKFSSQEFDN